MDAYGWSGVEFVQFEIQRETKHLDQKQRNIDHRKKIVAVATYRAEQTTATKEKKSYRTGKEYIASLLSSILDRKSVVEGKRVKIRVVPVGHR